MVDDRSDWHLDRRVTVGLIGTLILQTAALGVWAGTITLRVTNLEDRQIEHVSEPAHRPMATEVAAMGARQSLILSRQEMILNAIEELRRTYRDSNQGR